MTQLTISNEEVIRSRRVSKLLQKAISLPKSERAAFIRREALHNPAHAQQLEKLLATDYGALEQLTPMIYEELVARARIYMRREAPGHDLAIQDLVHETFIRLTEMDGDWEDRQHFFGVAARLMRRILVDHAKARFRAKSDRLALTSFDYETRSSGAGISGEIDVLDIDYSLEKLAAHNPRLAELVELHYFGGLTYDELSNMFNISRGQVDRDLRVAKAWLLRSLQPYRDTGTDTNTSEEAEQEALQAIAAFHERLKSAVDSIDSVLARIAQRQRSIESGSLATEIRASVERWSAHNSDSLQAIADLLFPAGRK